MPPLWDRVRDWCTQEHKPVLAGWIEHEIPVRAANVIAADQGYFRIKLVQMVLGHTREWFKDYAPSVHAQVQLEFGDSKVQIPGVLAAEQNLYTSASVFQNLSVLPLCPFRGGEVSVDVALVAIPGDDHLANGIQALSNMATLISAPLSGALAIASKVKESAEILVRNGAEVHLAYRNTFSADPGPTQLRDGYIAIVNARPDAFPGHAVIVENDQLKLWDGKNATDGLPAVDYMLLRVQVLTTRDDKKWLKDIEAARSGVLDAFAAAVTQADKDAAERTYRAAVAAILKHRELIDGDKRALLEKLKEKVAPLRAAEQPAGAVGPRRDSWESFVSDLTASPDRSPLTEAEFLAR